MSSYVIVSQEARFETRVRRALDSPNGEVRRLGREFLSLHPTRMISFLDADANVLPDVLVVGPEVDAGIALELAERVDEAHPEINVVLAGCIAPEQLELAMRAGVRDVVMKDADQDELRAALRRAAESAQRRRRNLVGETGDASSRRVITVVSPKGGSGKTTVATNLAVGLARQHPGQVAIVDLDLTFGDVGSALGVSAAETFATAAAALDRLDALSLKAFLAPHPDGLHGLLSPDNLLEAERITPQEAGEVVRLLAGEFQYVVIDTPAGLTEHTAAALDVTTDIVLLCTMDVPSVRSLRRVVTALDDLGYTIQRRHFVLNRAATRVGLDAADIERTLGMAVDVHVPSSREVPLSTNQGDPIMRTKPRSPVARRLAELVTRFSSAPASRRGLMNTKVA